MLRNIDTHKMNILMEQNEEARQIINQLLENHLFPTVGRDPAPECKGFLRLEAGHGRHRFHAPAS